MKTSKNDIEHLTEAFLADGLTAREQAELQQLLKVAENKDYFKKMYTLWYAAHYNDDNVEQALQRALFRLNRQRQQPRKNMELGWFFTFRKIAAALLIAFSLGAAFHYWADPRKYDGTNPMSSLIASKVIVPLGSHSQVELPDGTLVSLNAGSNLHYKSSFGMEHREVWLEGEGYFKVVKNAIPFIVKAKDVTIKALGTEFNVKAYPEENTVQTTLVNGVVTVAQTNAPAEAKEMTLKPKQTVTIYQQTGAENTVQNKAAKPAANPTAGKPAREMEVAKENVELKDDIDIELYTSWKDPRWVFQSEPLSDLAMKLQRRYNVQFIIADKDLKQYPVSGILTDETLEQVLDVIKTIAPVNYSVKKRIVTLSINPHQKKYFDEQMKIQ